MNDLWAEMPYVFGCIWWWILFPCILIAIPWFGFWLYWCRDAFRWGFVGVSMLIVAIAVTLLVIVGYIAAMVAYEADHTYDGRHEWRDGAGHNTVCHYEVRSEMVGTPGKGGHYEDHTYTVCIDSER